MVKRKTQNEDPENSDDINVNDEAPDIIEVDAVENAPPGDDVPLALRILWVRERVTRLGKDSNVSTGGSGSYKAISHDKVTGYLRPLLVKAGIISYLSCSEATDAETGSVTSNGKKIMQHQACFKITFANAHKLSDNIEIKQMAYADDYGDKAPGKATSYAMKYALLKMFMVETGEEDEERVQIEDNSRGAKLLDSEQMSADFWAVADEVWGDDAKERVKTMAKRRFFVEAWGEIPQDRYADALRSMRVQGARDADEKAKAEEKE